MNPVKIITAYKGYLKNRESIEKNESYRARQIAYMVYCSIPLRKGTNHTSIGSFWPIDEGENKLELTRDERDKIYHKNRKWLKPRQGS